MTDVFDELEGQLRTAVRDRAKRQRRASSRASLLPTKRPGPPAPGRRGGSRLAGIVFGAGLCAALATVAVLALEPDGGSAGFLARAAAALKPLSGTILHERWTTRIAAEPGNIDRSREETFGPEQLWIEGAYPRRYRTILQPRRGAATTQTGGAALVYSYGVSLGFAGGRFDFHDGQDEVLGELRRQIAGRPLELGGSVESAGQRAHPGAVLPTLTYLPSGRLLRARLSVTLGPALPGPHEQIVEDGADPVALLRAAIAEGRAHEAGSTTLGDRSVRRIDIDLSHRRPADAPPLPADHPRLHSSALAFALVEPGSFHPVEIVYGLQTYRFLNYEYLPATAANRALSDMRSQHPGIKVLNTVPARPR